MNRHIAHDIKNRVQGININDTAFKFSEYATKVAGLMNTEKDDSTKTFKVRNTFYSTVGVPFVSMESPRFLKISSSLPSSSAFAPRRPWQT